MMKLASGSSSRVVPILECVVSTSQPANQLVVESEKGIAAFTKPLDVVSLEFV